MTSQEFPSTRQGCDHPAVIGWPLVNGAGQVGTQIETMDWKPGTSLKAGDRFKLGFYAPDPVVIVAADQVVDDTRYLTLVVEPFSTPTVSHACLIPDGVTLERLTAAMKLSGEASS